MVSMRIPVCGRSVPNTIAPATLSVVQDIECDEDIEIALQWTTENDVFNGSRNSLFSGGMHNGVINATHTEKFRLGCATASNIRFYVHSPEMFLLRMIHAQVRRRIPSHVGQIVNHRDMNF